VNSRRPSAFIDSLAAGRRPGRYGADPEDVALLRTAIALRAARPGEARPSEQFVSDLDQRLSDHAPSRVTPDARPGLMRRGHIALAALAASAVLVGGTVAATDAFIHTPATPAAAEEPHGKVLPTGTFQTADSRVLGQIVAYRGHPSWVFMNVDVPNYDGPIICELQVDDGSTVAFGTVELHHGIGQFSKTIRVEVGRLRGAKLVTSTGAEVASATFTWVNGQVAVPAGGQAKTQTPRG
jgi:hypothetical protein